MPREIVKAPVVIAEPVERDRICSFRDNAHSVDVKLILEEDAEEQIRSLCLDDIEQSCIHSRLTTLLVLGHKVEVGNAMTHMRQRIEEIAMLEAMPPAIVAVVIFGSNI